MDEQVVGEVLSSLDAYRHRHVPAALRSLRLVPVIVTNGELTASAKQAARVRGVEVFGGDQLQMAIMASSITRATVDRQIATRLASLTGVGPWLQMGARS